MDGDGRKRETGLPLCKDYLNNSSGDKNYLLFHGFLDCHLVLQVHFVKFIIVTHTLERQSVSVGQTAGRRQLHCNEMQ